jgi:hypothetical protein
VLYKSPRLPSQDHIIHIFVLISFVQTHLIHITLNIPFTEFVTPSFKQGEATRGDILDPEGDPITNHHILILTGTSLFRLNGHRE